jgi:ABC-2 type transport system ATP-binding protein
VGILHKGRVLLERSLSDLQDNIVKVQTVFQPGTVPELPRDLEILHTSCIGRVYTYIIRGNGETVGQKLAACQPVMIDILPLSLEEIFIYELGGEQYAVKDILF